MKLFTIPNLLTLGNLFCGCLAVMFLHILNIHETIHFIILILLLMSLVLDLLDGMIARLLKSNSEIGIQLDSLADMVSFGFLPGALMTHMLDVKLTSNHNLILSDGYAMLTYFGFLITLFSALRLAKFNIDSEQTTYFKGLATPANTILIFSLFW